MQIWVRMYILGKKEVIYTFCKISLGTNKRLIENNLLTLLVHSPLGFRCGSFDFFHTQVCTVSPS